MEVLHSEKDVLWGQLALERELVIDAATGNLTRKAAWERIDGLLERLHELNILAECVDLEQL